MIFDLHSHTNFSDGVLEPQELISRALEKGVDALAMRLSETAVLDETGRIVSLEDVYLDGQDEVLSWFERHSAEFDPSYL